MDSRTIDQVLSENFRLEAFRPGQRELIEAVLAGRDALGILPTGGGKSLCYQLPAILLEGLTVVVSPLIALMKDQVDAFNRRGGALAVAIHSNQTAREASDALGRIHRGEASLLYVAPERMALADFRARLVALRPSLLVIDEAHCVSMWGHDFRPTYLSLAEAAASMRPAPVLALTATATPQTRADIARRLDLRDPLVHVAPFDRPNLRFEVIQVGASSKKKVYLRFILEKLIGSGSKIVYVGRRRDADEIAADLESEGHGAVAYHAGLDPARRKAAQEAWLSGEKPIAVATIAFGMGIDKPDVRAVIHYQHPASLESYYQEAGRAGRDGEPARCILLTSGRDASLANFFIRNRYPTRAQVLGLARAVSPEGTPEEELRAAGIGDMTGEQFNVALLALLEEGIVRLDGHGRYRREDGDPNRRLSLAGMFARKDGDYRRLEAMVGYAAEERCHRAVLLRYFGEGVEERHRCGNCSACGRDGDGGPEPRRPTGRAGAARAAAMEEVARIVKLHRPHLLRARLLTPTGVARFLAGSSSKKIPPSLRDLPEFGALGGGSIKMLREMAEEVISGLSIPDPPPAAGEDGGRPPAGMEFFWRSPHRAFTRTELESRQVERRRGLLILSVARERPDGLPPSRIVNVLQGGADSQARFGGLPQWARLQEVGYDDLLADVLAMWAKGYLEPSVLDPRKLVLAEKGRTVIGSPPRGNDP